MAFATPRSVEPARRLLQVAFVLLPLAAGIDKLAPLFLGGHIFVDWHEYLAPAVERLLPGDPHAFMYLVGGIEILAGILVAARPVAGGWLVAAWLLAISLNLVVAGEHYDVALRDVGLAFAAASLALLSRQSGAERVGGFR